MAEAVLLTALQIVTHVDTPMASVLVRRDGWAIIVQQVNACTTEKEDLRLNCDRETSNHYKCTVSNIY